MQWPEVNAVLKRSNKAYQTQWEQTRYSAFISAISNGAKIKNPQEMILFSWEEDTTPKVVISPEEWAQRREDLLQSYETFKAGKGTPAIF